MKVIINRTGRKTATKVLDLFLDLQKAFRIRGEKPVTFQIRNQCISCNHYVYMFTAVLLQLKNKNFTSEHTHFSWSPDILKYRIWQKIKNKSLSLTKPIDSSRRLKRSIELNKLLKLMFDICSTEKKKFYFSFSKLLTAIYVNCGIRIKSSVFFRAKLPRVSPWG